MIAKRLLACALAAACLVAAGVARAAAKRVPIRDFYTYSLHLRPELSPGGRYLSLLSADGNHPQRNALVVYDLKTNKRWRAIGFRNIHAFDNEIFWNVHWVNDHRVITETAVRIANSGPSLTGKIFAVDLARQTVALLQGPRWNLSTTYDVAYSVLNWLPHDPGHILTEAHYFRPIGTASVVPVGDIFNRPPTAYLVDVKSHAPYSKATDWSRGVNPNGHEVMSSPLPDGDLMADNEGRIRIAVGYSEKTGRLTWRYRAAGSRDWKTMPADLVNRGFGTGPIGFTPGDRDIYLAEYAPNTHTLGLYVYDPRSGKSKLIYDNPDYDIDVDRLIYGYRHEKIIGAMLMPGRPQIVLFDRSDPVARILLAAAGAFKGRAVTVVSTDRDASKAVLEVWSDRNPGRFYLIHTKTMRADPLFKKRPDIDPKDMAAMTPIRFEARDGLTLHGYLTLPNGKQKDLPMIVYVHGGPFGIQDTWGFDPMVQLLANRGYAVLQVNFRGSGGYGWPFEEIGFRHWGTTMQYDVIDGTRWAIKHGYADPKRICIFGASYGGFAALRGAELAPSLYQCTVGYDGVYDLAMIYKTGDIKTSSFGRHYLDMVLGRDMAALEAQSATTLSNVAELTGGIFLIQGGEDVRAPQQQVDELKARLQAAGKQYEYLYKSREAHGFLSLDNQRELARRLLAFFARYIGPDAHADTNMAAAPAAR